MSLVLCVSLCCSDAAQAQEMFSKADGNLQPAKFTINGSAIPACQDVNSGYHVVEYTGKLGVTCQYLRRQGQVWDSWFKGNSVLAEGDYAYLVDGAKFAQHVGIDAIPGFVCVEFS